MNQWIVVLLLAPFAVTPLTPEIAVAQVNAPILEINGTLEPGDAQADDGSLYDDYRFGGEAGQAILIQLESAAFDTYLWLLDAAGNSLAENDDANGGTNSQIGIVLPETDTYQVRANAYDDTGQGSYRLVVTPTTATDPSVQRSEAIRSYEQGIQAFNQADYTVALEHFRRSLNITRDLGDRRGESAALHRIGGIYDAQGEHNEALSNYQRALAILQDIGDREAESYVLQSIGSTLYRERQFEPALSHYEAALAIVETHDVQNGRSRQASLLNQIGFAHFELGQKELAIAAYEKAIVLFQELGDRSSESEMLNNIGRALIGLDRYVEAETYHQQALAIAQAIADHRSAGIAFKGIGDASFRLARFAVALEAYQQALNLHQMAGDRANEMLTHNGLGFTYERLGQYFKALENYQKAIALSRELNQRTWEGQFHISVGRVYIGLRRFGIAEVKLRQAFAISEETGARQIQAYALSNLETLFRRQRRCVEAITLNQRALYTYQAIRDLNGEGIAYGGLAESYRCVNEYDEALNYYQKALAIQQVTGNRNRESWYLSGVADVFVAQNQPEIAILFLKRSINVVESIREELRSLETNIQQSYVSTVARNYRLLADLLLAQGRIPEAQQVLDLLQLEELREFTDTRAAWTSEGIQYTTIEAPVVDAHGSLIALGSTLTECERTNCPDLDRLYSQQESLLAQYDTEVTRFTEAVQVNRRDDDVFQNPENISGDAQKLLETYADTGQTPVLVYPFVLEDKLWLVWVTVGDVIGSVEVPVSQGELATTVQRFGALLQDRNSDLGELQATSQQLYSWIIEPLATELDANNVDHLVFVNDRVTRYIPMAALYDGEQYLAERYTLSTVLAPGATNFDDQLETVESSPVLGLGLTQAVSGFNALPAVYGELTGIVENESGEGIYPGQVLLDDAFTLDSLKANVASHRILHMATHAEFVPGRAEESYIVLGDGSQLKIPDIETMQRRLRNLHLVVLSACQTALGGANQDGTEIAGLSSYFLEANRAEAVLASLWAVSDGTTSLLMRQFYENLASGQYSEAEALRQAQLSFLKSDETAADVAERLIGQRQTEATASPLSHPYYWAPFILIGNGL